MAKIDKRQLCALHVEDHIVILKHWETKDEGLIGTGAMQIVASSLGNQKRRRNTSLIVLFSPTPVISISRVVLGTLTKYSQYRTGNGSRISGEPVSRKEPPAPQKSFENSFASVWVRFPTVIRSG